MEPNPDGMPEERVLRRTIRIGPGVTHEARVDVTAKGNGSLTVANLEFRVYDSHDDGRVFEPPLLDTTFADLTGDGYLDLVVHGMVVNTDDPADRCAVLAIYKFNSSNGNFEPVLVDDGSDALN